MTQPSRGRGKDREIPDGRAMSLKGRQVFKKGIFFANHNSKTSAVCFKINRIKLGEQAK